MSVNISLSTMSVLRTFMPRYVLRQRVAYLVFDIVFDKK
jgi:hypothetical protein